LGNSISPLDYRYQREISELFRYFSEESLNTARLEVEVSYLVALTKVGVVRPLSGLDLKALREIVQSLPEESDQLKQIELTINHDTKAVEYFLRRKMQDTELADIAEFVHFGLTSTDTDNLAWGVLFKRALSGAILPHLWMLVHQMETKSKECLAYPMLGRTHGQPAVPTTLGRQFWVFMVRLESEVQKLANLKVPGKLTGAVGDLRAHRIAYPQVNWDRFSRRFVQELGLEPKPWTTQIPPYEDLCEIFDTIRRINTILLGLDRDIWDYCSRGYFTLQTRDEEVGSSTMPQKINPIDFERSEAYLKVANALLEMLSRELPQNRLQRDLTDKYLLRVVGEAVGYSFLSWKAFLAGLEKLQPNPETMANDLLSHWEVLSEAVQIILRKHGCSGAFDLIKDRTRGLTLNEGEFKAMVRGLKGQIPAEAFEEIVNLHPLEVLQWE